MLTKDRILTVSSELLVEVLKLPKGTVINCCKSKNNYTIDFRITHPSFTLIEIKEMQDVPSVDVTCDKNGCEYL